MCPYTAIGVRVKTREYFAAVLTSPLRLTRLFFLYRSLSLHSRQAIIKTNWSQSVYVPIFFAHFIFRLTMTVFLLYGARIYYEQINHKIQQPMQAAEQEAPNIIGQMPKDSDMDEIMYRLYVLDRIRRGQEIVEQGMTITSEELQREIDSWWNSRKRPCLIYDLFIDFECLLEFSVLSFQLIIENFQLLTLNAHF